MFLVKVARQLHETGEFRGLEARDFGPSSPKVQPIIAPPLPTGPRGFIPENNDPDCECGYAAIWHPMRSGRRESCGRGECVRYRPSKGKKSDEKVQMLRKPRKSDPVQRACLGLPGKTACETTPTKRREGTG